MSLAQILEWKYGNKPGMQTREVDGKMEIHDWPSKLGSEPTAAQIKKWTADFEALPTPEDIHDTLDRAADEATTIAELKAVVKDVIKVLK